MGRVLSQVFPYFGHFRGAANASLAESLWIKARTVRLPMGGVEKRRTSITRLKHRLGIYDLERRNQLKREEPRLRD